MDLTAAREMAARLSMWAYLATTRPDGRPHVVPVHPCWSPPGTAPESTELFVFSGAGSQKARNIRHDPRYALHYTVGPDTGFDHLIVEGRARLVTDVDEKRTCWGLMDYPLEQFGGAGGPEDPATLFVALAPERVVSLYGMGSAGRDEWRRE